MALQGCASTPDRQKSLGRSPHDHFRTTAFRSMRVTLFVPLYLSHLARAYVEFGKSMTLGAALAKQ